MKLLTEKKRKIAILFTAGLGDTLLYVPLLKELKRRNFNITCIFYSKFNNDCLFDMSLVDSKVFIPNKFSLLLYAIRKTKYFSNIYINHFATGLIINLAAGICGKRVSKTAFAPTKKVLHKRNKAVIAEFSDAEQNLHLLFSKHNASIKNIENFYLPNPVLSTEYKLQKNYTKGYFILQVSAGNNTTPFKNWAIANWLILTEKLCNTFINFEFIIVGDHTETSYIKDFENLNCANCKILIGKTTLQEVFNLAAKSNGYIGLDSGIMHIAVALQKKTVTIFGASNEKLYGYEMLDPANHKEIISSISCRPCSGWKNANTTRVTDPMQCPDFACLASISTGHVFKEVCDHFDLMHE